MSRRRTVKVSIGQSSDEEELTVAQPTHILYIIDCAEYQQTTFSMALIVLMEHTCSHAAGRKVQLKWVQDMEEPGKWCVRTDLDDACVAKVAESMRKQISPTLEGTMFKVKQEALPTLDAALAALEG